MRVYVCLLATLLFTGVMFAQSSGNFTFGNTGNTHCVLNGSNGQISGGDICYVGSCITDADCAALTQPGYGAPYCSGATATTLGGCVIPGLTQKCAGHLNAGIKVSSGSGNVLVIRPSAVIGLLTNVSLYKSSTISIGTSSAYAGVDFEVLVNGVGAGQSGGRPLPPPCMTPNYKVTYAARFVQISSNLFDILGDLCTGANVLPGGATNVTACYFNFAQSTVSAHSFDWIVGSPQMAMPAGAPACSALSSGVYGITANWYASVGNSGLSQALTCVGPVNLTVQQNKVFSFNTVNQ